MHRGDRRRPLRPGRRLRLLVDAEVGVDLPFVMQEITITLRRQRQRRERRYVIGDLLLYGKFKRQLAEHWAGAIGLEISAPTGSSSKFLGSGDTGLNPFLSTRYQSGPFALGGHSASCSTSTIRRMSSTGASRASSAPTRCSRCAVRSMAGRSRDGGENFNDIAVWPGLDFNLTRQLHHPAARSRASDERRDRLGPRPRHRVHAVIAKQRGRSADFRGGVRTSQASLVPPSSLRARSS